MRVGLRRKLAGGVGGRQGDKAGTGDSGLGVGRGSWQPQRRVLAAATFERPTPSPQSPVPALLLQQLQVQRLDRLAEYGVALAQLRELLRLHRLRGHATFGE